MKTLVVASLLLTGCSIFGGPLTPGQQIQRQHCLTRVESAWREKAEKLCPSDVVYWDECTRSEALEEELAASQRKCSEDAHHGE